MKKLTDEQLSRILSEHAVYSLMAFGNKDWKVKEVREFRGGCAFQVILNEPDPFKVPQKQATVFDENYQVLSSPEALLRLMRRVERA